MQRIGKLSQFTSRTCYVAGMLVVVFLVAGFLRFSFSVASYDNSSDITADGIVVLTGGKSRIESGLQLLQDNRAGRMFISGVNPGTSDGTLVREFAEHGEHFSCCIDIGRVAKNTANNAVEAASWVKRQKFKHIIVVTSDYHMPRAMLEFSRVMPTIKLSPVVASNTAGVNVAMLDDVDHMKIMIKEYAKTIATSLFSANANYAGKF